MDNEKKTIRFIDSDYRTLFTIPDGDKITLTFSDGETVTRSCKYPVLRVQTSCGGAANEAAR